MTRAVMIVSTILALAGPISAQDRPGRMIELADLHRAARTSDPRSQSPDLLQQQLVLRLRTLSAQRLPSVSVEAQAQTQSDVATSPFLLANGEPAFIGPRSTYDVSARIDERLIDSTVSAQAGLERAQNLEQQARVQTALFSLRQQVNDAFFAAAALEHRRAAVRAAIEDLTVNLRELNARVQQGTVLNADAQGLEATLLQRQQDEAELTANRRAVLSQLERLTGEMLGQADVLVLPDLATQVSDARRADATWRSRPEYQEFARTRERLERQQDLAAAQDRPQLSAFARLGYGKPGLNFVSHDFESYAVGGLQLRWRAWNWNASERERAALALQQRIISAEQGAFTTQVARATEADIATIDRLTAALEIDARIVGLREQVVRTTETRLREGAATASEYTDRTTELLQARINLTRHEVERAEASARLLTTIGVEVR
jgi:outer membrane protein TolC